MSIMTQLEFELEFSQSEKQIAKYILNHGEEVLSMSVKELAKETYTSPATIVRLCKKIGLDGYNDFKSNILPNYNMIYIILIVLMSIFLFLKMTVIL